MFQVNGDDATRRETKFTEIPGIKDLQSELEVGNQVRLKTCPYQQLASSLQS